MSRLLLEIQANQTGNQVIRSFGKWTAEPLNSQYTDSSCLETQDPGSLMFWEDKTLNPDGSDWIGHWILKVLKG